jgi:thymidylate synthase
MDKRHPERQYLDLIGDILKDPTRQEDGGTGDVTLSVFGRQMRFDLSEGFPLLTTKKVYWKGVLQELYWFLSGQSNIKYLVDNGVHIWDDYPYRIYREKIAREEVPEMTKEEFVAKIAGDADFAAVHGELAGIYGESWRRWPAADGRTVDQLAWAVNELREDPNCHNAIVNSWNPPRMYGMAEPGKGLRFPICHNMYQFSIQHEKVCLQLYQRSADIFLGVPFNIASYALLTHIVARALGREVGEFVHTFGDVHVYENHLDQVREQLSREPRPLPTITIDASVKNIDDFRPEHVTLEGYDPHPPIKAELATVGGLKTADWKTYNQKKKQEKS